ncbi:uncharacterized protein [Lepeophtheirus salmonis]|uniref:uncharacterized protein n=1 Tax=Lepeophtheirus salmonis TaxID=72036 RepID=UPI001AE30E28|nr:uncharacterized protein LOC121115607 [Lepeophtheirus salmonis]XP_040565618.1 uncharacterized protein LOC121115607 [Lepeophtheirus salmonis]
MDSASTSFSSWKSPNNLIMIGFFKIPLSQMKPIFPSWNSVSLNQEGYLVNLVWIIIHWKKHQPWWITCFHYAYVVKSALEKPIVILMSIYIYILKSLVIIHIN